MEAPSRRRWLPAGLRVLVYGTLAATIYYLQPLPRCYFNVFGEDGVLSPCLATGEKILLRAPYRAYALSLVANHFKATGQIAEAIAASEQAFALDPKIEGGNSQVLEMLFIAGRQQRAIKNYANALDAFTRALAYEPNQTRILIERAQTYLEIAAFDRALTDYDHLVTARPEDGAGYRQRALAKWQALQDPTGALIDFEIAITLGDKRSVEYRTQLINLK